MHKDFSDRLRSLRKEMKLSQEALGKKINVTKAMVSLWEKGSMPREDKRPLLARALGTDEAHLFYGRKEIDSKIGESVTDAETGGFVLMTSLDEAVLGSVRLSNTTFANASVTPSRAAFFVVNDSSMHPLLPAGALTAVDKDATVPVNGAVYVVAQGKELRTAFVYKLPGGRIRLRFSNAEEYPEEVYPPDNSLFPRIKGRVFWYSVTLSSP